MTGDLLTPKRIQRQRTKGWRMPEGAVSVTRPGPWGNPWQIVWEHGHWIVRHTSEDAIVGDFLWYHQARSTAVWMFRAHLDDKPELRAAIVRELRGKDLACWCRVGEECHADVLLEVANVDQLSTLAAA